MKRCVVLAVYALGTLILSIPSDAKTLVFCTDADPESLNPQVADTITGVAASEPNFEGLVRFGDDGSILPDLAETWSVSPDQRTYTFHLRQGVRFQSNDVYIPKRDFDADDVMFSFDRQWRESNPYHHLNGQSFTYFNDMGFDKLLDTIDRVDDHTVRFSLKHPEAPFLADLAMPFAKLLSAEYADAMLKAGSPDLMDSKPIGTGPFSFGAYQKNVAVRYDAFKDHWAGRPPLDNLIYSITPNATVRFAKLKAGECQVAQFPKPGDVDDIEHNPDLSLIRQKELNVGYIAMNTTRPPFDDVRVRRAVNMAIDRDAIVKAIYGELGTPAKNPLPPTLWSYNDAIAPYPYDPAEAQRLMLEAGHGGGFETDLWYMPVTRAYNPDSKRMAEMVADDLDRIGVRVHLVTAPWPEYVGKLLSGGPSMAFTGWLSDNGDPDNFLGILLGCRGGIPTDDNVSKWCDPRFDALIADARSNMDHAAREKLYEEAQVVFHDQAPWVTVAHGVALTAIRRDVQGFKVTPFGRYVFDETDIRGQ